MWCCFGACQRREAICRLVLIAISFDANFLAVLPIISFAFTFHTNVLLVWNEMSEFPDGTRNMHLATNISTSTCFVIYLVASVFGYLSFQACTSDNILTHYDDAAWPLDIGKVGYGAIILFSYPLLAYPLRCATESVLHQYWYKLTGPPPDPPLWRLLLVSGAIFVASYSLAIAPIGIGVVFASALPRELIDCFANSRSAHSHGSHGRQPDCVQPAVLLRVDAGHHAPAPVAPQDCAAAGARAFVCADCHRPLRCHCVPGAAAV